MLISNRHAGFFLYRAGLVITRWMLEKDIIVTPTLQQKKLDRVAPVDNRASNDKNGAPKQWWLLVEVSLVYTKSVEGEKRKSGESK